jgi:flotillin
MAYFSILPLLVVVLAIAVLVFVTILVRSMWKVASPNEALIVSGMGGGKEGRTFKIVTGGGTLVIPGMQTALRLSLNLHEAQLAVQCVTKQGIPVIIQGVCIYKISDDPASITNAARRFLGQERTMDSNIQNLFDGHLRSIVGTLTVEQLISDRVALTDATRDAAKVEVENLGLKIDSLQIKDIGDPTGYIENLAKPHIAAVQQAARIAQAQADQAEAASLSAIQQAQYAANTSEAQAQSAQQGPLATAKSQQEVVVQQTKLAQLKADQTEQELQVSVRKPADAEAYRLQRVAEGQRAATIAQAEADAQRIKLAAEAEGGAITVKGTAEADVVRLKLTAEADGIKARAAALATNSEAVISQKIAELIPAIVREAAAPFANIKELVVTSGGEGLNNMVTGTIASVGAVLPALRKAFTGDNGKSEEH